MSLAPGVDDGVQWTPDQDEMLKAFLSKSNAGVPGANPPGVTPPQAPIGVPSTPPVVGTPPPPPPDNEPESKIADSHPGNDALLKDIQSKEGQIDKYGPDQQKAVMDMIAKEQGGLGTKIGQAGSTLADGIMQGVARAGNPGFAKQYNENLQNKIKLQAGAVPQEQEMNAKNMAAKQGLEELSPKTPIGASSSPAISAVAKMYKMTPDQVNAMMKSNPQTALKLLDQVGQFATGQMKAEIEQQMKLLEIQVQQNLGQQGKNIEAHKAKQEASKAVLGAGSPLNPFNPVTYDQKKQALANLSGGNEVKPFATDVTAYAQKHGITPEQAQDIKNKRTGGQ